MANQETSSNEARKTARRRTRREFLTLAGSTTLGLALAACAPAAAPTPTPAAKPAPAPTPAAPAPKPAAPAAPTVISKERRQIIVSTWGGTTEEGLKKVVAPLFEKRYNATVEYDLGPTAPRLNKLKAQAANPQINVIFGTDDTLLESAQQGLFLKNDPSKMPNLKNLYDWATPGAMEGYGAAVGLVAYGLAVVKDKVKAPVKGWKDMWRDEFKGKLAFTAPANTQMPPMLIMVSEFNGGSAQNIEPGLKALAELRPAKLVFAYVDYVSMIKSGDVILGTEFDYNVIFMQKEGYPVSFVLPEEKGMAVLEYVAVVKGAPNQELGEAYLDLLLDPEVQAGLAKEIYYGPANKLVKLDPPLSEQLMYGPRVQQLRWFDPKFNAANRAKWLERINTEVVPKWRL